MSTHMPYDQARYEEMRKRQQRAEADAGDGGLERRKLVLKGRTDLFPIYRFPTDLLLFNKQNGRIHSEVLAREAQEGRKLEPSEPNDQQVLKELLLAIRPDENDKISDDIQKNGQLEPGIVTCDGIVINGNRRKAILETLYESTSDARFRFIEVQVLPSSVTKSEVWLIEAGIQMSASQQLDYSPINNLLKYREGIDSGITEGEMAARIYGATEDRIREDLKRLDLIDEYLSLYLQKPGRYYLVADRSEHFINLQNILRWLRRPVGRVTKDWEHEESDIAELKLVAFQYIRDAFPHMRIRELRDLFCIQSAWLELRLSAELPEDERPEAEREPLPDSDEDDEEQPEEQPKTDTELADRQEEAAWRKKHNPALRRNFERAKEQQQIERDATQPLALARRALRNLEGIRADSEGADDPDLDFVLGEIIEVTNSLRSRFMKTRPKRTGREAARSKRPTTSARTRKKKTTARKGRKKK
jgi:hypothetical protein